MRMCTKPSEKPGKPSPRSIDRREPLGLAGRTRTYGKAPPAHSAAKKRAHPHSLSRECLTSILAKLGQFFAPPGMPEKPTFTVTRHHSPL